MRQAHGTSTRASRVDHRRTWATCVAQRYARIASSFGVIHPFALCGLDRAQVPFTT